MTISETNIALVKALSKAKSKANDNIVKSTDLDRDTRERLVSANYLIEVIKGWYILTMPSGAGTTTLWFSNYWAFIREYLNDRFKKNGYCITAESSLEIYSGQNFIPDQLMVMTKRASNQTVKLKFGTSLLLYKDEKSFPKKFHIENGLNLFQLPEALASVAPSYFRTKTLNLEISLKSLKSVADLSRVLLDGGLISAAERLTGAFSKLGEAKSAKQIIDDMASAGYLIKPTDPFKEKNLFLASRPRGTSPHAWRVEALWNTLRKDVIKHFPNPTKPTASKKTLAIIERLSKEDAYHSLSIEGYQVTEELIERIKLGKYDPDKHQSDQEIRNALAAKGYLEAFKAVLSSIGKVLEKKQNPGYIFRDDLQKWYRQLFSPLVKAGLSRASDLAGYRDIPVYINNSRHVPVPVSAVLDAMEILENLLITEINAGVRAVLGHFLFAYIHPYSDGNGRIARFLMNFMLISGGFTWTVIKTSKRNEYLSALEEASTKHNIVPFTKFIASEMDYWSKHMQQTIRSAKKNPKPI